MSFLRSGKQIHIDLLPRLDHHKLFVPAAADQLFQQQVAARHMVQPAARQLRAVLRLGQKIRRLAVINPGINNIRVPVNREPGTENRLPLIFAVLLAKAPLHGRQRIIARVRVAAFETTESR